MRGCFPLPHNKTMLIQYFFSRYNSAVCQVVFLYFPQGLSKIVNYKPREIRQVFCYIFFALLERMVRAQDHFKITGVIK